MRRGSTKGRTDDKTVDLQMPKQSIHRYQDAPKKTATPVASIVGQKRKKAMTDRRGGPTEKHGGLWSRFVATRKVKTKNSLRGNPGEGGGEISAKDRQVAATLGGDENTV